MPSPGQGGALGTLPTPEGLGGSLVSGVPTPTHFWPMNEGSGSTFFDAGSIPVNLTTNDVTWATSTGLGSNPVANFSGGTSFAFSPTAEASLNFNGTTPFSVSLWFNTISSSSETFLGNLQGDSTLRGFEVTTGGTSGLGLLLINNFGTSDDVFYLDGTAQPTNAGTFLVVTYDGLNTSTSCKVYVNGTLVAVGASGTLATPNFSSTSIFIVGARNSLSNPYSGAMAFIRTWTSQLTQANVTTLYGNGPQ